MSFLTYLTPKSFIRQENSEREEERKCARESDLCTQSDGATKDDDTAAFIKARRGQAGRPVQCQAALPAASRHPRRCLARRPAGGSALVADDAAFVEVGRPAGHHHGHSPLHHSIPCLPFCFASCTLRAPHSCCPPDQRKESGADRPRWGRQA